MEPLDFQTGTTLQAATYSLRRDRIHPVPRNRILNESWTLPKEKTPRLKTEVELPTSGLLIVYSRHIPTFQSEKEKNEPETPSYPRTESPSPQKHIFSE